MEKSNSSILVHTCIYVALNLVQEPQVQIGFNILNPATTQFLEIVRIKIRYSIKNYPSKITIDKQ